MSNIKEVTFYFANPMQDHEGLPVISEPPESHTLSWSEVTNNVGFALSTGENMFTELPDPNNDHIIRVVNAFYFGTGVHGSLLAIRYLYEDNSDGWISSILHQSVSSRNLDMIIGNWIKGLSYMDIVDHDNWVDKPYIGVENDYVEIEVKRVLPDMFLSLESQTSTILRGESVTFEFSSTDHCPGEARYEWFYNSAVIRELSRTDDTKILEFNQAGTYTVELVAKNDCEQTASRIVTVTVNEPEEQPCDISLSPSTITIRLGETATFNAIHPYGGVGSWTYDLSMEILNEENKILRVKPKALGSYSISYQIDKCQANALLYVLEPLPDTEWEDPVEPAPPPLPDTPPDSKGAPNLIIDLADASRPIPPLHKYPNIMKRNSRYRGHRESEKVLNDHQEQIYDIRQIHKDLSYLEGMKDTTIRSWFHGLEKSSILAKSIEKQKDPAPVIDESALISIDSARGFDSHMVQLTQKRLEEHIVGVYGIKQRMQELDERIAEAERRYRLHENAYE